MALENIPTGFICYNNSDLIRDGYIFTYITKEYQPDDFNMIRLENPDKGVSYKVEKDEDGNITKILERRKQLPSDKIKIEIIFTALLKNALSSPVGPGEMAAFGGLGGGTLSFLGPAIYPLQQGGITLPHTTSITYHICDTETKINMPIKVTEEMLEGEKIGIIEFDNYPLSIFGIVKEHEEKNEQGQITKYGLNFTPEELENIGKFSSGQYEGSPKHDIQGATNLQGLFGGRYEAEVNIDDILMGDQINLFIEIIRDKRTLKFRADNEDASDQKSYPPYVVNSIDDITDKKIRIKTDGLKVGDILYATMSIASERRNRELLNHVGRVFQENLATLTGKQSVSETRIYVFDYQISSWFVPKNIPETWDDNSEYVLTLQEYMNIKENESDEYETINEYDIIEGWRLSEAVIDQSVISSQVQFFWAADYRGILLVSNQKNVLVVFDAEKIRDQEWFRTYLENLDFTIPTGFDGEYLDSDLEVKIEDVIEFINSTNNHLPGFLFDISESNNSLLFDREKLHYYKPLALALNNISSYNADNDASGVGIVNLDLLLNSALRSSDVKIHQFDQLASLFNSIISNTNFKTLSIFDLSYSFFQYSKTRPLKRTSCEGDIVTLPAHFNCDTYDPSGGIGIFFSLDFLTNEFLGWRPAGGYSTAYWKYETPYYCGDFTNKTRIYIEKMGGDSISPFGLIYVNSVPIFPYTISNEYNSLTQESFLIFREDHMHESICYHKFSDGDLLNSLKQVHVNLELNHDKGDFDHHKHKIIGYNKLLGERPNYSDGIPVTNVISKYCDKKIENIWTSHDFLNEDNGLYFDDEIPTLTLPDNSYLQGFYIEYNFNNDSIPTDKQQYISLLFTGTNGVINNFFLPYSFDLESTSSSNITCKSYRGNTLEFLGDIWKFLDVQKLIGVTANESLNDSKLVFGQMSVVNDKLGRLLIFYNDEISNNISVAVSHDQGERWSFYKDIIGLVEGEVAALPRVINRYNSNILSLFYVLNNSYIMYTEINTNFFRCEDLWIDYTPPLSYKVNIDYKKDNNDPNSPLYNYSDEGRAIREKTSYFVVGNAEDTYFKEQMIITQEIKKNNIEKKVHQPIRFDFRGDLSQMTSQYNGSAFAIHIDTKNRKKIFIINNNLLSIKTSSDYFKWNLLVENVQIHKDFFVNTDKRGEIPEVKNIQIARIYESSDFIPIMYFNNNMLFLRIFRSSIFEITNGEINSEEILKELEIRPDSYNKPIFLVGELSPEIIKAQEEQLLAIEEGDTEYQLNLAIVIPFGRDFLPKFNNNFSLDTDTQPYGYTVGNGLMRIFYKDNIGELHGIIVSGYNTSVPEVMYELNDNLV